MDNQMNPVLQQSAKMSDPIGNKTERFARQKNEGDGDSVLKTTPNLKPSEEKKASPKIEQDTILSILYNGDNTRGLFATKAERCDIKDDGLPRFEKLEQELKLGSIGTVTPSEKYEKAFFEEEKKNFKDYTIQTPKGEMTVAEAIKRGYNPITKEFVEDETGSTEGLLNKLENEDERNAVRGMIDPRQRMMPKEEESASEQPPEEVPAEPTEEQPPAEEEVPPEGAESNVAGLSQLLGGKA